jgi:hypothetical protein
MWSPVRMRRGVVYPTTQASRVGKGLSLPVVKVAAGGQIICDVPRREGRIHFGGHGRDLLYVPLGAALLRRDAM